jgi:hypothetical protein
MRMLVGAALLLMSATALAQLPEPEQCLAYRGDPVVEIATFSGREYRFRLSGCRAQFETDPERFAQLYDALLEMKASGQELPSASPSLVPS